MNRTCLILCAALALTACGKDKPAEGNQAFSDEDFTQGAIVANDVTAIDAATGDAANMAADVPPDATLDNQDEGDGPAATAPGRSETRASRQQRDSRDARNRAPVERAAPDEPVATTGNTAG